MIKENEIYKLTHYEYGLPYTGQCGIMRYRIARNPLEKVIGKKEKGEAVLEASVWKGPFCYDKTKEEIITMEFPFTEEGRIQAVEWLNSLYIMKSEEWK